MVVFSPVLEWEDEEIEEADTGVEDITVNWLRFVKLL